MTYIQTYIQCSCGGRVRCGECRHDICYCNCPFTEPTDAVLAGHGINTEVPDPGTHSHREMADA